MVTLANKLLVVESKEVRSVHCIPSTKCDVVVAGSSLQSIAISLTDNYRF